MSDIIRYEFELYAVNGGGMGEDPDGAYVEYDDYKALLDYLEKLESVVEAADKLCYEGNEMQSSVGYKAFNVLCTTLKALKEGENDG